MEKIKKAVEQLKTLRMSIIDDANELINEAKDKNNPNISYEADRQFIRANGIQTAIHFIEKAMEEPEVKERTEAIVDGVKYGIEKLDFDYDSFDHEGRSSKYGEDWTFLIIEEYEGTERIWIEGISHIFPDGDYEQKPYPIAKDEVHVALTEGGECYPEQMYEILWTETL